VTSDELDVRLAPVYEALERLDREASAELLITIPGIDWAWPASRLNPVLRALWNRIDLGPDLRPASADWTVPEWRA
jgi:hypothetical protein